MISHCELPWDDLIRSERRTLSITVMPDKRVVVRAPLDATEDQILAKVRKRSAWINKQKRFFDQFIPRTGERQYVSGEGHLYLGRRYRLKVIADPDASVKLRSGYIEIGVSDPSDADQVCRMLWCWYRASAEAKFIEAFKRMKVGRFDALEVSELEIRKLTKRWGSCTSKGKIILNLDLIRAPKACIEYVIVHELCHLIHPNHDSKFYRTLSIAMPDWKTRKDLLERLLS